MMKWGHGLVGFCGEDRAGINQRSGVICPRGPQACKSEDRIFAGGEQRGHLAGGCVSPFVESTCGHHASLCPGKLRKGTLFEYGFRTGIDHGCPPTEVGRPVGNQAPTGLLKESAMVRFAHHQHRLGGGQVEAGMDDHTRGDSEQSYQVFTWRGLGKSSAHVNEK